MTSDTTTEGGRRLSPGQRHEQLVAVGVEIVTTSPLDQLTADAVAERAGVSKGLVFHYFPSIRDLQAAVLRAAMEELLRALDPDPQLDPSERLKGGVAAFVRYIDQQPANYVTLSRSAGADHRLHEVFEEARERVTDLITAGIGIPDPPDGLRLALRGWIAMTEEVVLEWLIDRQVPTEQLVDYLHDALFALAAPVHHLAPAVEFPDPG